MKVSKGEQGKGSNKRKKRNTIGACMLEFKQGQTSPNRSKPVKLG